MRNKYLAAAWAGMRLQRSSWWRVESKEVRSIVSGVLGEGILIRSSAIFAHLLFLVLTTMSAPAPEAIKTTEDTSVVAPPAASAEVVDTSEKKAGRYDATFEESEKPQHALVDMSTIQLTSEPPSLI